MVVILWVASLGHLAVGMLVGRAHGTLVTRRQTVLATAAFAGLALLPDIDVIGLALGGPDDGPAGHRGVTHSLLFAAVLAVGGGLWARRLGMRPWPTAFLSFVAVASHGLLDAFSYDSRGPYLLWPLSDLRVASPWRPIPGAPTGLEFISAQGFEVAAIELIYFSPLILFALLWRRPGRSDELTLRGALVRSTVIGACVLGCLVTADLVVRDTRLVAYLESRSLLRLAVEDRGHIRLTPWPGHREVGGVGRAGARKQVVESASDVPMMRQ